MVVSRMTFGRLPDDVVEPILARAIDDPALPPVVAAPLSTSSREAHPPAALGSPLVSLQFLGRRYRDLCRGPIADKLLQELQDRIAEKITLYPYAGAGTVTHYLYVLQDRIREELSRGVSSLQIWNGIYRNMRENYKDLGLGNFHNIIHCHANPFSYNCLMHVVTTVCDARNRRQEVWRERSYTWIKRIPNLAKLGAAMAICPWKEGPKSIVKNLGVGSINYLTLLGLFHKLEGEDMTLMDGLASAAVICSTDIANVLFCKKSALRLYELFSRSGFVLASENLDFVWITLMSQETFFSVFFPFLGGDASSSWGIMKRGALTTVSLALPFLGSQSHLMFRPYFNREGIVRAVGSSMGFIGSLAFSYYMNHMGKGIDVRRIKQFAIAAGLSVATQTIASIVIKKWKQMTPRMGEQLGNFLFSTWHRFRVL